MQHCQVNDATFPHCTMLYTDSAIKRRGDTIRRLWRLDRRISREIGAYKLGPHNIAEASHPRQGVRNQGGTEYNVKRKVNHRIAEP